MVDIPVLLILAIIFLIIGGGIMGVVMLRSAVLSRLNPPMEEEETSGLPQTPMSPNAKPQPNLKLDLNFKPPTTPPNTTVTQSPAANPSMVSPTSTPTAPVVSSPPPAGQVQTKQTA